MKVLVLSTKIPFPLVDGLCVHLYNLARLCKETGNQIDLLAIEDDAKYERYKDELHKVFTNVYIVGLSHARRILNLAKCVFDTSVPFQVALYRSQKGQELLGSISAEYDTVLGWSTRTIEYLRTVGHEKAVLDMCDAVSYNYLYAKKNMRGIKKLIYGIEQPRVLKYECRVANEFPRTVMISVRDKKWLESNGAVVDDIVVIHNAVRDDINARKSDYASDKDTICFLGQMSYQPNVDAVQWFCNNVFPELRRQIPNIEFYIMGTNPSNAVKKLGRIPGVVVTGFVEDPYEIISESKFMVVPIRNGAGIQNKALESMIVGTPTILSPIAAEGIGGEAGEHYLVAGSAGEYVDSIVSLWEDDEKRRLLGERARRFVEENYTWDKIWSKWASLLSDDISGGVIQ